MRCDAGAELSQRDLVRMAFAGDDVEAAFAADKAAEVAQELPAVDAPSLMPGWGNWAGAQREPQWMRAAQQKAQR
jgi:U3 small nucleolar RNA-associated protein 14